MGALLACMFGMMAGMYAVFARVLQVRPRNLRPGVGWCRRRAGRRIAATGRPARRQPALLNPET
ncbi:exported hypothetical protein [Cupriavidus taiwanensis]|uniref:Uncharacterized protein n=1 Tax=Cupriavidus taiwanensis TaxID=164546 RepID=A0A375BTB1_9BURK|nr:exported hypothetical protein [Cupriavidus taiwanensis]